MSSSNQPARLRPFRPQPFGRYTLLSHLATGGMGEIYLARLEGAQGFEKLCVIKKILPQLAADQEFVERFVGEARTLVRLGHGSIAQVLDMGLHEDEAYMALEYVDGKDLRKVAARVRDRQTPLPLTFVLYVMGRVLDALAYAHRKRDEDEKELKLVHRDISPQNILISYEGEVKVIDFGLAKSRLSAAKTNPSIILGKFLYMSPEQARHQPVDRRSDLYAVGLCLYELISGQNPFDVLPPGELMSAVANPKIPLLNEVEPLTPPSVSQLVAKALAVEPGQRFQTAEEFRGRLQACLMEIDTSAGPESVSRFMRDLFSADYQSERRLLASLREVPREPRPSGTYEAQGAPPRPTMPSLPPKTIRLDGPLEPLSFHPTPRSREDGGGARDDGETRPGVMVDESTRPAFPVEALEEAARARARPNPTSSEPSPTVEVREEAMERPTILEGLPAIRLPSDPPAAEEAPRGPAFFESLTPTPAGPPLGEPTSPRAASLPIQAAVVVPAVARAPSSEPASREVPDTGSGARGGWDARGASLPFSDAVAPRAAPSGVEPRAFAPPPPPPPMSAIPAIRPVESGASGRLSLEGPVPVVPADASRPVAPPPPPSEDFGAAQFDSAAGGSLPFMEPPPPPDGPFFDEEEDLPPSPYPWPEPRAEAGRFTLDEPRASEPPRAEVRIPEGQRPTAAMPASNGSRPLPAHVAPTIQVPSIQSSAPLSTEPPWSTASEEPDALDDASLSGPAPRPTMQDTRPSSELVSVDVHALEPESGLPYITAEPEDPHVARQGDADTHPRIAMPRAPRREEPQPRVVLDEALLRETNTPSARREPDTGPPGPTKGRTGSRRSRGSSPGTPVRTNTASSMRAVTAPRAAPAADPDESSTSRSSRDDTRRKAMPTRPADAAESSRPAPRGPAPARSALRSVLLFTSLVVVALLIVGLGLYFVPELRVAVGLEQSTTLKPPPPTRVQPPHRAVTAAEVPPSPGAGASDVSPTAPVVPPAAAVKPQAPDAKTPPDAPTPPDDATDLLAPDEPTAPSTPAPSAKKAAPPRSPKRGASVRGSTKGASELEQQWARTSRLFLSLEGDHTCVAMGLACSQFDDLEQAVRESSGEDPALLRTVKKFHAELEKVRIRQGSK